MNIIRQSEMMRALGNEWCEVTVELRQMSDEDARPQLSISGVAGEIKSRRSPHDERHCVIDGKVYVVDRCGQIRDDIARFFPEVTPYFKWHLNGMHAGCEHQAEAGWRNLTYTEHEYAQKRGVAWSPMRGVVVVPEAFTVSDGTFVPPDVMCQPCWVCGYKFGSQWLYRALPQDVVDWAMSFGKE